MLSCSLFMSRAGASAWLGPEPWLAAWKRLTVGSVFWRVCRGDSGHSAGWQRLVRAALQKAHAVQGDQAHVELLRAEYMDQFDGVPLDIIEKDWIWGEEWWLKQSYMKNLSRIWEQQHGMYYHDGCKAWRYNLYGRLHAIFCKPEEG